MTIPLRVLLLEDSTLDAELIVDELERAGYAPEWRRVDSPADFVAALDGAPDVILSDYRLPRMTALDALHLMRERKLDIPVLVVTGSVEETALQCLPAGAVDYLVKDRLARLGPAIQRALDESRLRAEKRRAESALRESEARYRQLCEMTSDFAYALRVEPDRRLTREWMTEAFTAITGFAAEEMEDARAVDRLVHEDDRLVARAHLRRVLDGQRDVAEFRVVTRTGRVRWLRNAARPVADADTGRVARILGAAQDVTERRLAEEEMRQAQKLEALGLLAGGVAHDFNNLLSAIIGFSDLLMLKLPPADPQAEYARLIHQSGQMAAALTRQLLAFGRKQRLAPTLLNPGAVVEEFVGLLRRTLGDPIEIVVERAPDLGSICVDRAQFEQVLLNLAVNARDAMPGGGRLTLSLGGEAAGRSCAMHCKDLPHGEAVRLTVTDTGTGMSPEVLRRVFEPFFTTKEPGRGTGLGLATVYGIVRQSGGNVNVTSRLGRGTTVCICLPRVEPTRDPAPPGASGAQLGGSETVLLIDDSPGILALGGEVLRGHGYTVLTGDSPSAALRVLREHVGGIDLLITDLSMTEMTGIALAAQAAALRPGLRILYISGYLPDAADLSGALNPQAPFLAKPLTPTGLLQKVREVLGPPRV